MKKIITFMGFILVCNLTFAETRPSDASLQELFKVSELQQVIGTSYSQIDTIMKNTQLQALGNVQLNAEQQKIADEMNAKIFKLFKSEMSWEKVQPTFLKIYKDTFSQEEVDGIINFYKSSSGQAMLKKMPLVSQATLATTQKMMQDLIPQLIQIQQEGVGRIKQKATPK